MEALPTPDPDLGLRLAGVEHRLEAISERLGRLEVSLGDTVAIEVSEATAELRRAISELGRRLVQDLPAELARHRDLIVAELRPPPPPPPPAAPESPPAPPEPEADAEPESAPADDAEVDPPDTAAPARGPRRRRRQP
jgi:hypothetical protein